MKSIWNQLQTSVARDAKRAATRVPEDGSTPMPAESPSRKRGPAYDKGTADEVARVSFSVLSDTELPDTPSEDAISRICPHTIINTCSGQQTWASVEEALQRTAMVCGLMVETVPGGRGCGGGGDSPSQRADGPVPTA